MSIDWQLHGLTAWGCCWAHGKLNMWSQSLKASYMFGQVMLYKSELTGPLGAYLSMRDIKPEQARSAVLAYRWLRGRCCSACSSAPSCPADAPLPFPHHYLQYVSKLVIVPGIVTAASRPKHKATYVTIQCKTCK